MNGGRRHHDYGAHDRQRPLSRQGEPASEQQREQPRQEGRPTRDALKRDLCRKNRKNGRRQQGRDLVRMIPGPAHDALEDHEEHERDPGRQQASREGAHAEERVTYGLGDAIVNQQPRWGGAAEVGLQVQRFSVRLDPRPQQSHGKDRQSHGQDHPDPQPRSDQITLHADSTS